MPNQSNIPTAQEVIAAYVSGIFPMANSKHDDTIFWVNPEVRGIIPLDHFKVSRSLKKQIKKHPFEIRLDSDFSGVITACSEITPNRSETWINEHIKNIYIELFSMNYAHSVECWKNNRLVGGLYGLAINGAFFGESMFSKESNASKIALVHLVAILRYNRFTLLDTQFMTEHLTQFGAQEISRQIYHQYLSKALSIDTRFYSTSCGNGPENELRRILQSSTQTS